MRAVVVDTNVLEVANGRETHAPPACVIASARALQGIPDGGLLVLDDRWRIIKEYQAHARSSGEPGPGDRFLRFVLTNWENPERCELVRLTPRGDADDDFEELPDDPALVRFDRSDRKFVAVALASQHDPPIMNAVDTDWWHAREALERHGVQVEFLCQDVMEASGSRRR
jgi:hypothetical protein